MREGFRRMQGGTFLIFEGQIIQAGPRASEINNESKIHLQHHRV